MNVMTFELEDLIATMLAGIAQFGRDLLSECVNSGLAAARARGKQLGRQPREVRELQQTWTKSAPGPCRQSIIPLDLP
jgi:DNA invertase Pin-like site-specific DNA recombinase